MKVLASVDNVVLGQDASKCLIPRISVHHCLDGSVELGEEVSRNESCLEFVEGLLLCMSLSEGKICCQVDQRLCHSPILSNESTVIVRKA